MVHRNLESRGCECWAVQEAQSIEGGVQVRNSAWMGVEGRQTRVEECVGMKAGETFLSNVCHFVTLSSLSYLHFAISFSKTDAQGLRLLEWQISFSHFKTHHKYGGSPV